MLEPLPFRPLSLTAVVVGIQLLGASVSSSAMACGGFFCSAQNPVNQAAERIVFAQDRDGTITQIVEIMYEGPAERFAWVLPVPGVPDVEISSSLVFSRLQNATNPVYQLNDTFPDECSFDVADGSAATGGTSASEDDDGPRVTVLDQGSVGPFDYETIQVDPADQDPADVALQWLEANDYDVSSLGPEVLRPYLAGGLNLMAFRLQKGVSTGAIRPISITYEAQNPAIPIRPTAVAANDDMGVMVWVLGDSRAVPINYKGLELNELYIDWITGGSNYDDVVTRAADEAGGQGFVTELAEPADRFHEVIHPEFDTFDPQTYDTTDLEGALVQISGRYATYDGYTDVLRSHATFREPLTAEDFVTCPNCYFYPDDFGGVIDGMDYGTYDPETDPIVDTDLEALFASVEADVLAPIAAAADLFLEHPYVTRLYTTMSAAEMTEDPFFDFNPDLDDVSNIHTAERLVTCSGPSGHWKVTLADGRAVYGVGFEWPVPGDMNDLPYNTRILEFSTSGQPKVLQDNQATIGTLFEGTDPSTPNEAEPVQLQAGGGGCSHVGSATASTPAAWLLGLFGLGYMGVRRRRRLNA